MASFALYAGSHQPPQGPEHFAQFALALIGIQEQQSQVESNQGPFIIVQIGKV